LANDRDLAPARCRFRSTQFLSFGGTLLNVRLDRGVSPRCEEPPAAPCAREGRLSRAIPAADRTVKPFTRCCNRKPDARGRT